MLLMRVLFPIVLLLAALSATPGRAQQYSVAPNGSDSNSCVDLPCATFQHAIDLCPTGGHCSIDVQPGTYSQAANLFYYKVITIQGPNNEKGKCGDRRAVIIDGRDKGPLFFVQDHAILTISCMTLTAHVEGVTGFGSRQFAIGDVNNVDFLKFPAGDEVAASETSKINVSSPGIYGDANRFAIAQDLSQITIGGDITLANRPQFDVAFVSAITYSIITIAPLSMSKENSIAGASYQCANSSINANIVIPGNNTPYLGNANCTLNGKVIP